MQDIKPKRIWFHGNNSQNVSELHNGVIWGTSKPTVARSYTNSDVGIFPIITKDADKNMDAKGSLWKSVYDRYGNGELYDTNTFSYDNLTPDNVLEIKNVVDFGPYRFSEKSSKYYIPGHSKETYVDYLKRTMTADDIVIGKNVKRKSLLGNNGDFNISNIYKVLIPSIGIYANSK